MRNERDQYYHVRGKQASRSEIKIHLLAVFFGALAVYIFLEAATQWLQGR